MRLVAIISETSFLVEFCFEKTGIAKREQQEQESDFNIEYLLVSFSTFKAND
jgi:hypothetical protein